MKTNQRRKTGKVTLADVAKSVGVSTMTVSRALRDPEKVATPLKERIFNAIDELGYIPNSAASHLASAHSKTVVLIVNSFSALGFKEIYRALSSILKNKGYRIIVESLQDETNYRQFTLNVLSYNPEALVFLYVNEHSFNMEAFKKSNIPLFSLYSDVLGEQQQYEQDFEASLDNAVSHLLGRNKQNIGFLVMEDHENSFLNNHLLTAWNRAMLRHNKAPNQLIYHLGNENPTSVYTTLETVVKTWPDVDAVICSHAALAYGTIQFAKRNGISVPQQLAVVSLVDDQTPYFRDLQCTHIEIAFAEQGTQLARNILTVLEQKAASQPLTVQPHLVKGITT